MFPFQIPPRALARAVVDIALVGAAATGLGMALVAPLLAEVAVHVRTTTSPTRG